MCTNLCLHLSARPLSDFRSRGCCGLKVWFHWILYSSLVSRILFVIVFCEVWVTYDRSVMKVAQFGLLEWLEIVVNFGFSLDLADLLYRSNFAADWFSSFWVTTVQIWVSRRKCRRRLAHRLALPRWHIVCGERKKEICTWAPMYAAKDGDRRDRLCCQSGRWSTRSKRSRVVAERADVGLVASL